MKKYILAVILILAALVVAGCVAGGELLAEELYLTVVLTDGEGYTITSPNPQKILAGGSAKFNIEVDPAYIIDEVGAGALLQDGAIVLENVNYPVTVEVSSRLREEYTYQTIYDVRYGKLTSSEESRRVLEGTEVTLTATPNAGAMFLGYSIGGYLKNGGEIVGYSTEYTFTVDKNIRLYANYAEEGSRIVIYDSNGGAVVNSSMEQIYVEIANSRYICPNALYDGGNFSREGYVLYGYNTEPDGSGRYYGLGWNIVMDENVVNLYAQWMKETDPSSFRYKISGGKVQITGYTGNDETVVIPESIDGNPVTSIAPGAFTKCNFSTMYFSKNLFQIADNAIVSCTNFKTLYFSDSIFVITDKFYQSCPNFSTLYMNAVNPPRYMTSRNGNYQVKFERLITAPGKKLIITAGSNCAYGVISEQLMEGLGGEYSVVNYGCNQSTPAAFYIEVASKFINEGDILLHVPEIINYQWGYNEINTTHWQIFEGAYDAFSYIDIRSYIKVFSSFSAFNSARQLRAVNTYEQYSSETVNIYGDYIKEKKGQTYTPSSMKYNLDVARINNSYNVYLNRALDMVSAAGGRCYISFAAINYEAVNATSRTKAQQDKYMNAAAEYIHATVISTPGDYIMENKYFFNSDYHLNTEGAVIRTNMLIRDIKAQFAKEK